MVKRCSGFETAFVSTLMTLAGLGGCSSDDADVPCSPDDLGCESTDGGDELETGEAAADGADATSTTGDGDSGDGDGDGDSTTGDGDGDSTTGDGDGDGDGDSTTGDGDGDGDEPVTLRVMSLNVYGYATMPQAAPTYAALIEGQEVDVIGIQEGVQDWQLSEDWPSDYSRAEALGAALGECYQREYQVFVNVCRGNELLTHERFDLTDGPNATRAGEVATIRKGGVTYGFLDLHWDHESASANAANADETAAQVTLLGDMPVVVLGDLNASCTSTNPESMRQDAALELIVHGGIDCIFSKDAPGTGMEVDAQPSDHEAVVAELTL